MTEEFYARYPVDPARLVIDVRGTGLTGFEVSDRLAEQGVDVEMADFCRIVGIPSVMTTQADMDALKKAMLELPHGKAPKVEKPGLHYGVRAAWPREAAFWADGVCEAGKRCGRHCGGKHRHLSAGHPAVRAGRNHRTKRH